LAREIVEEEWIMKFKADKKSGTLIMREVGWISGIWDWCRVHIMRRPSTISTIVATTEASVTFDSLSSDISSDTVFYATHGTVPKVWRVRKKVHAAMNEVIEEHAESFRELAKGAD
jgi:hypothetical protein